MYFLARELDHRDAKPSLLPLGMRFMENDEKYLGNALMIKRNKNLSFAS